MDLPTQNVSNRPTQKYKLYQMISWIYGMLNGFVIFVVFI